MGTVGRVDERDRLEAALRAVLDGTGSLVTVHGAPGLGKSHLVGWTVERATGLGCQVHVAACIDVDRYRPYGPLLDALAVTAESERAGWTAAMAPRVAAPRITVRRDRAREVGDGSALRSWLMVRT